MRISDWSSDVCSSDLLAQCLADLRHRAIAGPRLWAVDGLAAGFRLARRRSGGADPARRRTRAADAGGGDEAHPCRSFGGDGAGFHPHRQGQGRSEEHTSELQSLMRISYAVFCLKKKKTDTDKT